MLVHVTHYCYEAFFLKNYQKPSTQLPLIVISQENRVSRSEYIESMGFAQFPLSVEILSLCDKEGRPGIGCTLLPKRAVERGLIIKEEPNALGLVLSGHPLVKTVSVLDGLEEGVVFHCLLIITLFTKTYLILNLLGS